MINNLGDILQTVIDRNNLTQKEAAEALHLSPQALNSYIKNRRIPDMVTFQHIVSYFHLDANFILQVCIDDKITHREKKLLNSYRKLTKECQRLIDFLIDILLKL